MRRPAETGLALRGGPLVKASWTNASGVEGIPLMATDTGPKIFLSRRPIAKRASDARTGRAVACVSFDVFVRFVRHYVGGSFCDCTHDENYERETAAMP